MHHVGQNHIMFTGVADHTRSGVHHLESDSDGVVRLHEYNITVIEARSNERMNECCRQIA